MRKSEKSFLFPLSDITVDHFLVMFGGCQDLWDHLLMYCNIEILQNVGCCGNVIKSTLN